MTEVEVIAKKWGSSLGVIIPKTIVEKNRIKVYDRITVEIKKSQKGRDLWGVLPFLKGDAQKAKKEMRQGWG